MKGCLVLLPSSNNTRNFVIEYAKDLHIFVIKVEESNHTNNALIESTLRGQQE